MKIITTKKGHEIFVSDEDFEWLSKYTWTKKEGRNTSYACTKINSKQVLMHRLILNVSDRKILVDHKDRNGLNNTRENLRFATNQENQGNTKRRSDTVTSKGVSKYKNGFIARIMINQKSKYLGFFETEELAHEAYKKSANEVFGEFANFE